MTTPRRRQRFRLDDAPPQPATARYSPTHHVTSRRVTSVRVYPPTPSVPEPAGPSRYDSPAPPGPSPFDVPCLAHPVNTPRTDPPSQYRTVQRFTTHRPIPGPRHAMRLARPSHLIAALSDSPSHSRVGLSDRPTHPRRNSRRPHGPRLSCPDLNGSTCRTRSHLPPPTRQPNSCLDKPARLLASTLSTPHDDSPRPFRSVRIDSPSHLGAPLVYVPSHPYPALPGPRLSVLHASTIPACPIRIAPTTLLSPTPVLSYRRARPCPPSAAHVDLPIPHSAVPADESAPASPLLTVPPDCPVRCVPTHPTPHECGVAAALCGDGSRGHQARLKRVAS